MRTLPRTAIVTGAASGLGAAMARRLAADGFRVAITDRDGDGATALLDRGGFPAGSFAMPLDVTDEAQWAALVERTGQDWDGVGVLVNNAGVAAAGPLHEDPLENWRWVFDVNVFGVVAGTRSVLPDMRSRQAGHIINIASFAALAGAPAMSNYGASKAAVVALSESLHTELAGTGIVVSVACPAFIRTALLDTMRAPEDHYRQRAQRWMDQSGISAEDFAERVWTAAQRGDFMVLTHADTRWMWRLKRWLPGAYYAMVRRSVRRHGGHRR
jgi:NADP-dependent 3-hydroxy acid dehydrogenase YdfG